MVSQQDPQERVSVKWRWGEDTGPSSTPALPGGGGEEDVIASKLLSLPTSVFIIPHSSLHKRPQSYLRACNAWVWEMGSISRLLWVIHISLIWTVPSSLKMDLSSLFLFFFWLKAGHKEASPYWTRLLDWDWFEAHSSGAPGSHATEQLCAMPSVILYI